MRSATIRDHDTGIFLCVLQREGNRLKTSVIIVIHDVAIIITDGVLRFERTPCKSSCPRTHDTPTFSLSPLHPSLSLSLSSFFLLSLAEISRGKEETPAICTSRSSKRKPRPAPREKTAERRTRVAFHRNKEDKSVSVARNMRMG